MTLLLNKIFKLHCCSIITLIILISAPLQSTGATLELIWKHADDSRRYWGGTEYPSWQGAALGGKYYIQNAKRGVLEVWDATGKVAEIPSGQGTNITKDSDGNIIVRENSFTKNFISENKLFIFNPVTGKSSTVVVGALSGENGYLFGRPYGNIYGNDFVKICAAQGSNRIHLVKISNGIVTTNKYDFSQLIDIAINPVIQKGESLISNNFMASVYKFTSNYEIAIHNPNAKLTGNINGNENSIGCYSYDDKNSSIKLLGYYITPGHNASTGYDIFTNGEDKYIIYTSGDSNADGFSIAEVKEIKSTPANLSETDNSCMILRKVATLDNDGKPLYNTALNDIYAHNLQVETEGTDIFIYQYIPGAYIAKYRLELKNGDGIINTDIQHASCYGTKGIIKISGDSQWHIYTATGSYCITTSADFHCAPGIYIAKKGSTVKKILVH